MYIHLCATQVKVVGQSGNASSPTEKGIAVDFLPWKVLGYSTWCLLRLGVESLWMQSVKMSIPKQHQLHTYGKTEFR